MSSRRVLMVALALSGLVVPAGPTRAEPGAPAASFPGSFVADASATAQRGTIIQLTPLPAPPPPPTAPPAVCVPGSLIRGVDVGTRRMVAFSFDDGPWPTNTRAIMAAFEARSLHATFFWVGMYVAQYPDIAVDLVANGHEVGNHSQTHTYSPSTNAREIPIANATIEAVTGVTPVLYRTPGLGDSDTVMAALALHGMCNVFTTVILGDHLVPRKSASSLCASFANTLHPGEIVMLHDGGAHSQTVAAVPCMLDVALSRGYEIVTVGELLRAGVPYSGPRPRYS